MYTIHFQPVGKKARYDKPLSILEAAQEAGVEILALCGGEGSCGRCRVRVDAQNLPPLTPCEGETLSEEEVAAGYRLACRTVVGGNTVIYVPETSRPRPQRLQVAGREEPVECHPPVRKFLLNVPRPTLEDQRTDFSRMEGELRSKHGVGLVDVDPHVLRAVAAALRQGEWTATVSLRGSELVNIEPGDATGHAHGVAVDLGSTKIAVYLVDLTTGETVEARGVVNPQIAYGEDIISRMKYALDHADGGRRLQETAIEAINDAIDSLCDNHGLSTADILEITVVGNTAMHHFVLGLSTEQLGRSPFVPVLRQPLEVKARQLGLHAAPGAYVYCLPLVAGFVGSDHVAMLLASRLYEEDGAYLAIDIGTNTEISLRKGKKIVAVSCASGPAFEGATISCGMKAAPGAIERVWIDPTSQKVQFLTIEGEPPAGICGSGILDAVAGMLRAGIMDERGRIQADAQGVRANEDNQPELVLATDENGRAIVVTQKDVLSIQLAKGAIRSGIDVLMDAAGISAGDINGLILAGAFGTFIDPLSAIQIGMLPAIDPDRIAQVGNAAGIGAKEVLISTEQRERAERLAQEIEYLELSIYPDYTGFFAQGLRFPRGARG